MRPPTALMAAAFNGLNLCYGLGEHAPGTLSAWARSPQELSFGPAPALLTRCVLGRLAERLRTKPAVVPAGRNLTVLSCAGTDFSCGVAVDFIELQLLARAAHGVCAQGSKPQKVNRYP